MLFKFNNVSCALSTGQILFRVSASLEEEQLLIVRGPSGAGKTTLLRILARLQPAEEGEIYLNGQSWREVSGTFWRSEIHYLAQKPVIFEGTVRQNLELPFELKSMKAKRLNEDQAVMYIKSLLLSPDIMNQDARTLSGGEAARMAFIRALLTEPSVLLLDEPTSALDSKARDAFYELLQVWLTGRGRAAILVSHTEDYMSMENLFFLDIKKEL